MRATEQVKTLCALGDPYTSYTEGFDDAKDYCLQIAADADALIAELAAALETYAELERIEGEGANRATKALKNYQEYVK